MSVFMALLLQAMVATPAVDPAMVQAAKDDAASARSDAAAAATAAATADRKASAAAAAVPATCAQPPAPDAMVATAGTAAPCVPRADAAKQTAIPPAAATTVSGGTFSGTWTAPLPAAPSRAIATVEGAVPYHCQIITKTVTAFTGKCWLVNTSATLPGVLTSLVGYTLPLLVDSGAGIAVTVLARQ
jgi:hypothetical protein